MHRNSTITFFSANWMLTDTTADTKYSLQVLLKSWKYFITFMRNIDFRFPFNLSQNSINYHMSTNHQYNVKHPNISTYRHRQSNQRKNSPLDSRQYITRESHQCRTIHKYFHFDCSKLMIFLWKKKEEIKTDLIIPVVLYAYIAAYFWSYKTCIRKIFFFDAYSSGNHFRPRFFIIII